MFTELPNVRPTGDHRRRWFRSANEELIVWLAHDDSIFGFQLCYDRHVGEKALTWRRDAGFAHERIDDGESTGMGHKQSPVLVADGVFDAPRVLSRFLAISGSVPHGIVEFVAERLRSYPAP